MKKIVIAASLLTATAFAMPTENGEATYTYQGAAIKVNVVSRTRNIPAPSSWTPPERIKSAPVVYVRREQPKRLGGGFSFSSPSFSSPSFSNPGYSNPSFSNPNYSNPSTSSPSFSSPNHSAPSFSNPGQSAPSFSNPGFSSPSL